MSPSLLLWMSTIWFSLNHVNSNYIDTSIANEYQDGQIYCNSAEDCTVICDTSSGCNNADIFCPNDYSCLIQCIASSNSIRNNCRGARIHCPSNGQCDVKCEGDATIGYACTEAEFFWPTTSPYDTTWTLDCSGGYSCQSTTIIAPDDYTDFSFACTGGSSCTSAIIVCPKYANCYIQCTSSYSCNNAFAVWPITGVGSVSCDGTQGCNLFNYPAPIEDYTLICDSSSNCQGAIIECPSDSNCNITCDGTYACKETSFIWSLNTSLTSTLTCTPSPISSETCLQTIRAPIYADNDNTDMNLVCSLSECYGAFIQCPSNAQCDIQCNDDYSCDGVTISWPDTHPYTLTCNGQYSCARMVFTPYDDGGNNTLIFTFNDDYSFYESILNCPPNRECNITCSGSYSCSYTQINCGSNALCNIVCTNTFACANSHFTGNGRILACDGGNGACYNTIFPIPPPFENFVLHCNRTMACLTSIIYCPTNAECHISCANGNSACESVSFVWPLDTNMSSTLYCGTGYTDICLNVNPVPHPIYYVDTNQDFSLSCSGGGECQGAIIHCPLNAGCFMSCDGDYACDGTVFKWTEGQQRSLTCGEYQASCRGITIDAIDNNEDFMMNCSSNSMCWRSTINCPTNASCTIICSAQNACGQAVVNGPIDNALTVDCAVSGCPTWIYAQYTSSFRLNSCSSGIAIWFPPKDANGDPVAIIDGAENLCMQYIKYYAINGWDDVTFTNYEDIAVNLNQRIHDRVNRMFCTWDYSAVCYFAHDILDCSAYGDTTCKQSASNATTGSPTSSPTAVTLSPTGITSSPTVITSSPTRLTLSPTGVTLSPTGVTLSPTLMTSSPTSMTVPPTTVTAAPTLTVSTSAELVSESTQFESVKTDAAIIGPNALYITMFIQFFFYYNICRFL